MPFRFETEWIEADGIRGSELSATWASLLIGVDDEIVTCVVDERARTVRNHIYVPLYVLAEWLVTNWWFLFHEVETPGEGRQPRIRAAPCARCFQGGLRVSQSSGGAGRCPYPSRLDAGSARQRENRVPAQGKEVDRE